LRVGNSIYKISGTYIDTLQTIMGCDSVVTTFLFAPPVYSIRVDSTICAGNQVQIGNQFYDNTGIFQTLLKSQYGCDSLVTLHLTVVQPLELTLTSVRTTSCTNIGVATVQLSRTNYPYNLRWSTGEQTNTIRNLAAGDYSVTVSDWSVCRQQLVRTVTILAPLPLSDSIQKQDANCYQKPYGHATITPFNGTPPYSYQWSNNQITASINNLYSGIYEITITDSDGCKRLASVTIQQPEILKKVRYDTICNGNNIQIGNHIYKESGRYIDTLRPAIGCDTMVTTHLIVRDTFILKLKRSICYGDSVRIGDTAFRTTGIFTRYLQSRLYCDSIVTLDLTVFPKINLAAQVKTTCAEAPIGAIFMQVSGGKPPYQCVWQPTGATTPSIEQLPAGNYAMRLQDSNACVINKMFVVPQHLKPDYTIKGKIACVTHTSGYIRFRAAAKDKLQWSFNRNSYISDSIMKGLLPRLYPIWVKDTQDCIYKQTIDLQPATPISVQLPQDTILQLGEHLKIVPKVHSIDAIRSWRWEPAHFLDCSNCPEPISTPTKRVGYRLVVENEEGCRAEARLLIDVDKGQKSYVPNVFSPNGDNNNDFFTVFGQNMAEIEVLQVFNRWGNRVFEHKNFQPNQPEMGWDGTFDGKAMPPDVFIYFAVIRWKDGEQTVLKGDVTLTR
jgi:gliding motility-associated-like protein